MHTQNTLRTLRLRPSLKKWLFVFIVCAAVSGIGLLIIYSGEPKGWYVFGPSFLGSSLVPFHYFFSYMELNRDGYKIKLLWRRTFESWENVDDFRSISMGHFNQMVSFRLKNATLEERVLPDTFGMKADELSALMTSYKKNTDS